MLTPTRSIALALLLAAPALGADANPPEAKAAAAKPAPQVDPVMELVTESRRVEIKMTEASQPELYKAWRELMSLRAQQVELSKTFGRRRRDQAQRELKTVTRKLEAMAPRFEQQRLLVDRTLSRDELRLKQQGTQLERRAAQTDDNQGIKEAAKCFAEAKAITQLREGIDSMRIVFEYSSRYVMTPVKLLGVKYSDTDMKRMLDKNPRLMQYRLTVMDYEADLKALAATEEDPATARAREAQRVQLERGHALALETLKNAAAQAARDPLKEAASLRRRIAGQQVKIDRAIKYRRSPDRLEERMAEYKLQLMEHESTIGQIYAVAGLPPPTPDE